MTEGLTIQKMFVHLAQITQILRKLRKFYANNAKVYATSEWLTTQKFSNPFREIRIFYLKYANFTQNTQNTQNLRKIRKFYTKNEKPCLNYPNFTQNLRKIYANYANLRKSFLRSYTKILSGQPLGYDLESRAWATCPAFLRQHAPSEGGLTFYFYFVTKLKSILK